MKKRSGTMKLSPKGVFLINDAGKRQVAAPIGYHAVGNRRTEDKTKVAQINFVNFDGERLSEIFDLSELLPANRKSVVARLADKGYSWPFEKGAIEAMFAALIASRPERRFTLVGAPGWYDGVYVTPDREYGAADSRHRCFVIDNETGANVASLQLGPGSLKQWKKKVAKVAVKSSLLRLSIAAAFAAPVLRPLGMDSFGLNLYSDTSTGKTSCLLVAASVSGLIGERGLPGWADSQPAIEQLMVGHRDNVLPLDETGDGEDKMPLSQKARLLAFAIARNRPRNLAKGYEKSSKLTTRDYRSIVLSTSERALGNVALTEGTRRLGGEEVRLIDVPATNSTSYGIFDRRLRVEKGRTPVEQGKRAVDNLRKHAAVNQGFALHKFLRRYTKDPDAVAVLKRYVSEFETKASGAITQNADTRICRNFAVMYAAAALAIDYGILPWGKQSTLKAIAKCLTASLDARQQLPRPKSNPNSNARSITEIATALREELSRLDLVEVKKGVKATAKDTKQREHADGFRLGQEIFVKPKRWNAITSADKAVLIQHNILRTEGRKDTTTMARKVSGIEGKPRYIVIDTIALDGAVAHPENQPTN